MEIKCHLDATEVFIADLIAWSTCFGHHYAHHQELRSIMRWLLPVVFGAVVFKLLVWCGAETCWASNKICNKNLCCMYLAFYFHILINTLLYFSVFCFVRGICHLFFLICNLLWFLIINKYSLSNAILHLWFCSLFLKEGPKNCISFRPHKTWICPCIWAWKTVN